MAKFDIVDLTVDDEPDLPDENRRLAQFLYDHGWTFEEGTWPASRMLRSFTRSPGFAEGTDWTLCFEPFTWLVGVEWPSDLSASYGERWRDVIVHLGPVMIVVHRWWLSAKHR